MGFSRGQPSVLINCDSCKKEYKIQPSYLKRNKTHCCSKKCQDDLRRGKYTARVERVCFICGNTFLIPETWLIKSGWRGKYCSTKCRWGLAPKFTAKERSDARNMVRAALKKGVFKQMPCRDCGKEPADAHHYLGYKRSNWLNVIWLCDKHHVIEHERLRQQGIRLG